MTKWQKELSSEVVHSMFMSRRLPDVAEERADFAVLSFMSDIMRSNVADEMDSAARQLFDCFAHLHLGRQELVMPNSESLRSSVQNVTVGGFWATWIKAQNAVLFIERTCDKRAIVSAWQVQIAAADVFDSVPPLVHIPEVATIVPWEAVVSEPFAHRIADLAANRLPQAVPTMPNGVSEFLDVCSCMYVRDYLLPALGGEAADLRDGFQCIAKKQRDQSLSGGGEHPWRRTPMWFLLKSILQFSSVRKGGDNGKAIYKRFMILVISRALSTVTFANDNDIIEAARKVGRRMWKLKECGIEGSLEHDISQAITSTMAPMEARWNQTCCKTESCTLNAQCLKFKDDVHHKLTSSRQVLSDLLSEPFASDCAQPLDPECLPRISQNLPAALSDHTNNLKNMQDPEHYDTSTALLDAERFVMELWNLWEANTTWPLGNEEKRELLSFLNIYCSIADPFYKSDVEGWSRFALVLVTITLLADRLACEEHPCLSKHAIGFRIGMMAYLCLPSEQDKKFLASLEKYADQRSSHALPGHTALNSPAVHENSFAVRYFQSSRDMNDVLDKIRRACHEKRQEKEREVRESLQRHSDLLRQANARSCEYVQHWNGSYHETRHSACCTKCSLKAQAKNVTCCYYSHLLPCNPLEQQSIVFDLRIPPALYILRDCLFRLADFCAKDFLSGEAKGVWVAQTRLQPWNVSPSGLRSSLSYTRSPPPLRPEQPEHITAHPTFIVVNGHDAILGDSRSRQVLHSTPTWTIAKQLEIVVADIRYEMLQFAVTSWKHNENEVIAKKSEAHEDSSLREFVAFGSLRAGIRLQVIRLIHALGQRSLSFDRLGVLDLVFAVLFQVGPRGQVSAPNTVHNLIMETDHPSATMMNRFRSLFGRDAEGRDAESEVWQRQAHELLANQAISDELCDQAMQLLTEQMENWTRHHLLLVVLCIGRAILNHAPDKSRAKDLLIKVREVAIEWISQIRALMALSLDDAIQKLRWKIVEIAAVGTLTYDRACRELLSTSLDVAKFIWFRTILAENILLGKLQIRNMNARYRNLLRRAMEASLTLEESLYEVVRKTNFHALTEFVHLHWSEANQGTFSHWRQYDSPSSRWYHATFEGARGESFLQVDVLRGVFLVDGAPVGLLPSSVTSHPLYARVFRDSLFEVQPSTGGGWRTSTKINGAVFVFSRPCNDGSIRIIEERQLVSETHVDRATLVPHESFRDDVPDALVDDRSHWLLVQGSSQLVFFRPPRYDDEDFKHGCLKEGAHASSFVLDFGTRIITEKLFDRKLIDVRSDTFKELFRTFRRLAPRGQVHVFQHDHNEDEGILSLPKLQGIQFTIKGAEMISDEYGSCVSKNQNLRTLIGLKHCLVLEEPTGERKVLVPHAALTRSKETVSVAISNLRKPPIFIYDVRPELRDLHGQKDKLAWLYLAKLHAMTSHPLKDPFLGRSGTAQSLSLLQGARCRGNLESSLGKEVRNILREIAGLSLKRDFFPPHLTLTEQNTTQTDCLPSLCSHDAFSIFVEQLEREAAIAQRLSGLELSGSDISASSNDRLTHRAYFLSREVQGLDSRLLDKEEQQVLGCLPRKSRFLESSVGLERRPVRLIAVPGNNMKSVKASDCLRKLLLSPQQLTGVSGVPWEQQSVLQWLAFEYNELPQRWLDLYEIARSCCKKRDKMLFFVMLLSFLAQHFPGDALGYFQQLCSIAVNCDCFKNIAPPSDQSFELPNQAAYQASDVQNTVNALLSRFSRSSPSSPHASASSSEWNAYRRARAEYDRERREHEAACDACRCHIESVAANKFRNEGTMSTYDCQKPKMTSPADCKDQINHLFHRWRRAAALHEFIQRVTDRLGNLPNCLAGDSWIDCEMRTLIPEEGAFDTRMRQLPALAPKPVTLLPNQQLVWKTGKYLHATPPPTISGRMNFTPPSREVPDLDQYLKVGKECNEIYEELLEPLRKAWTLAHSSDAPRGLQQNYDRNLKAFLNKYRDIAGRDVESAWDRIIGATTPQDLTGQMLQKVGLWTLPVPTGVLPLLLNGSRQCQMQDAIGAFASYLFHLQRAKRILRLLFRKDMVLLEKELSDCGHDEWNPSDYPEWILYELDNDLCIRREQAKVALAIITNEHGNRLLQMIMGAGKTAVIVPMVVANLARGTYCVRVTVLSSLYMTNAADWQFKLGGLLNKRLHHLSCRRDLPIEHHAGEILSLLKQVKEDGHFIVTVPEHRLSLENKVIELAWKGDLEPSANLQKVTEFLGEHGREVLDESDEILHPKYQLIYTLGAPFALDGGQLRWFVGFAILHSVASHAQELADTHKENCIELKTHISDENRHMFPAFRLLADGKQLAYKQLCGLIVDDFLKSAHPGIQLNLMSAEVDALKKYVLDTEANEDTLEELPTACQCIALLMRGFLGHEVLFLALHKRWRVDYGSHHQGRRRMAVPYRAKDVCAERTEFGHPDVASLLTMLHYYHAGLTREQLREAFARLMRKTEAEAQATYASWIKNIAGADDKLRSLSGINLDNEVQFQTALFPLLSRCMLVIDFWLDQVAFPIEAKQFHKKVVSTACDLCKDHIRCVTTGFSGTDDARLVVPVTIKQKNMEELMSINGKMLKNLMTDENNEYFHLEASATAIDLLAQVKSRKDVDVLLDAGALMLELTNKEVAQQWLSARPDCKAAIFFQGNRIDVVDHKGLQMPLAVSPYERCVGDCLVYMDDVHTRGSDFRLPRGKRAIVTLGKGMQKDKLLQACMRMRQLGNGHSVTFIASFEVHLQIKPWSEMVGHQNLGHLTAILSWCLNNTVIATCDQMPYFAAQGASYIRKLHAILEFADDHASIAKYCAEKEVFHLEDFYGCARRLVDILVIVHGVMDRTLECLDSRAGAKEKAKSLAQQIENHVASLVPRVKRYAHLLDEEQERELEEELEEQREVERPPAAKPFTPTLSEHLVEFARTGNLPPSHNFLNIRGVLTDTSFSTLLDSDWDRSVFITPDFVQTVSDKGPKDSFLRPVLWMLRSEAALTVLLSNFEAEALAVFFHKRSLKTPTLHLVHTATRPEQDAVLLNLERHLEPPMSVKMFSGWIHGDDEFICDVLSFLGFCPRQPDCEAWRILFEQGVVERDSFVREPNRAGVAEQLHISFASTFTASPVKLLRRLYSARDLDDDLALSPVGQLLGIGNRAEVERDIDMLACLVSGQGETHCYVGDTLVPSQQGPYIPVLQIEQGMYLRCVRGTPVKVDSVVIHPRGQQRRLVRLQTFHSPPLVVSADHRVMARRGARDEAVPASSLKEGDDVLVGSRSILASLESVEHFDDDVDLVELKLDPDESIEAMHPRASIQTRGERHSRGRRGRGPRSWPDTDSEYL